jgi:hypothetical protein
VGIFSSLSKKGKKKAADLVGQARAAGSAAKSTIYRTAQQRGIPITAPVVRNAIAGVDSKVKSTINTIGQKAVSAKSRTTSKPAGRGPTPRPATPAPDTSTSPESTDNTTDSSQPASDQNDGGKSMNWKDIWAKHKVKIIVGGVIVVVIAAGAAVYYFVIRKKSDNKKR